MFLIEIGGFGFMMVLILCFVLIKKKVSFSICIILKEVLNLEEVLGVMKFMFYILKLVFVI